MHRRLPVLALAAAVITLTLAIAALHAASAPVVHARRVEPTATPPSVTTSKRCRVETDREVGAARIGLSETVSVTLTVRGCTAGVFPLHVVFVVDNHLGENDDVRAVRSAIDDVVAKLDMPANPSTKVAVIGFGATVRTLTGLTNDDQRVRSAVRRARGASGDAVDRGLDTARRELARGRRGHDPYTIRGMIILFSSAAWAAGRDGSCSAALSAAGRAKSEGILVLSVLSGPPSSGGVPCMQRIATSPVYYFDSRQLDPLTKYFDPVRRQVAGDASLPVNLVITDTIAPAFDVDPPTVDPSPSVTSPDGRTLRWQLPATITYPAAAITVTYRLRPTAIGLWPVSLGATAAFTDARAARGTVAFPPASIEVVDPAFTDARICPATRSPVPPDVIAAALAHPERVSGWGLRCSTNQPASPANPLRQSLRLARPGMAYHPVANGVVWACGCR
ncbi:MAG: VWA domain-containing protein [Ardenticatenales bacterium]|nr:VWA domain-containing protein [Ardenticatenales bacterium]